MDATERETDRDGLGSSDRSIPTGAGLSDAAIRELQHRRFQERVGRVLEVMQRERVDWRGAPFITGDGRIGVRVVPVDLPAGRQADSEAEAQT